MFSDGAEQLLKETGQRKQAGSSTRSGPPSKKKAHKTAPSTSRRKSRSISQSSRKATKKASPTKKCTPGPVKKSAKSHKKGEASSASVSPLKSGSSSLPNNERPSQSPSKESTSHVQVCHKA